MIDRLVIYLLAGCLIFGTVVLLELKPSATDTAAPNEISRRAETPSAVRRQPSTRLDELLAMALARPLFSSTRRPPQSATNDSDASSDLARSSHSAIPGLAIPSVHPVYLIQITQSDYAENPAH